MISKRRVLHHFILNVNINNILRVVAQSRMFAYLVCYGGGWLGESELRSEK